MARQKLSSEGIIVCLDELGKHLSSCRKYLLRNKSLSATLAVCSLFGFIFCIVYEQRKVSDADMSTRQTQTRNKLSFFSNLTPGAASNNNYCPAGCVPTREGQKARFGGDITSMSDLVRIMSKAYDESIQRFKSEYGEKYYNLLWREDRQIIAADGKTTTENVPRARYAFLGSNGEGELSKERLVRRLMMKVLSVQIAVLEEGEANEGGCSCAKLGMRARGRLQQNNMGANATQATDEHDKNKADFTLKKNYYAKFIWATGGHSAAAGHGNIHNESYTAIMEKAAREIFSALGIEFIGRNYAMGGMSSSPDIALCMDQIFGQDIDVLGWDYAMTDGRSDNLLFYCTRAGVHPNMPVIFGFGTGGRHRSSRQGSLARLEQNGLGALHLDEDGVWKKIQQAIPDMVKVSKEEADEIPYLLKYFVCDGKYEGGEPSCGEHRYTNDKWCPHRSGRASWHPGWKHHSLQGHVMAMYMIEMLLDAVKLLDSLGNPQTSVQGYDPADLRSMLSYLQRQDDDDRLQFRNSTPPGIGFINVNDLNNDTNAADILKHSASVCHTALLPAQTRYLGILTESEKIGENENEYDTGLSSIEISQRQNKPDPNVVTPVPLVYDVKEREKCEQVIKIDYKDYFYVNQVDGWTGLTVPNNAEMKAYVTKGGITLHGIIVMCHVKCPWGKCPRNNVPLTSLNDGNITMEVDGQTVTEAKKLGGTCVVLSGMNGVRWGPGKAGTGKGGQYEVKIKVNVANAFVRITAVIVL